MEAMAWTARERTRDLRHGPPRRRRRGCEARRLGDGGAGTALTIRLYRVDNY